MDKEMKKEFNRPNTLASLDDPHLIHPSDEAVRLAGFGQGGSDRKKILNPLMHAALDRLAHDPESRFTYGLVATIWRLAQATDHPLRKVQGYDLSGQSRDNKTPISGNETRRLSKILAKTIDSGRKTSVTEQLTMEQRVGNFGRLQAMVLDS